MHISTSKCKLKFALLVFILINYISFAYSSDCFEGFYDCKNGKCIANFFHCDGDNDCGNFEDELDCMDDAHNGSIYKVQTCPDDHFACHDQFSTCLPHRWVCDGTKECANGADEQNCTVDKVDCGDDFVCANLQCVPTSWRCDGIFDCDDHSDENNCTAFQKSAICDKAHGFFECSTGECIPYAKVCDKTQDCLMGDDEGLGCHLAACHEKKCSHLCQYNNQTNSTECFCPPGYTILDNTCHDFDECAENRISNMCSQKCVNTEGSYRCECFDGYQMVNSSCQIKGQSPVLFYSTGREIRGLDIRNKTMYPLVKLKDAEIIVGMDFWPASKKLIYIGSKEDSHGSVYQVDINGTKQRRSNSQLMFHEDLKGIEGISVDWLAGHFYLTESSYNRIVVCDIDSVYCTTLMKNLSLPRGILTIPLKGKLYWTQWGKEAGIFESGMDGANTSLLIGNVSWPNDLAYDELMNRLYWCDGKDGTIEYYDLVIKMRHLVFKDHNRQPYSLYVFEDSLYWSDWATNTIEVCNKITGHQMKPLLMDAMDRFFGVTVYNPQVAPTRHHFNPCDVSFCSHLCLLKAGAIGYTCACPDHMVLSGNAHSCRRLPDPQLNTTHKVYTTQIKNYFKSKSNDTTATLKANKDLLKEQSPSSPTSSLFTLMLKIFLLLLLAGLVIFAYFLWKRQSFRVLMTSHIYWLRPGQDKTIRFVKNPNYEPDFLSDIEAKKHEESKSAKLDLGQGA